MTWFLEGIEIGLLLSILAGPLLFALLQAGIERGAGGGFRVALGIWISDWLFVLAIYWGFTFFNELHAQASFRFWTTLLGSFALGATGISMLLSKTAVASAAFNPSRKSNWQLISKGFLLNTLNPFTIFFWMGAVGAIALQNSFSANDLLMLCLGIMLTITLTDSAKVFFAKGLRRFLSPIHILWIRRGAGLALTGFGLWLLYQAAIFV